MHENPAGGQALERVLDVAQYHSLFAQIREGFFVGEVRRDASGSVVDFVFLEVNQAFARQTGISPAQAVGQPVSRVIPGVEPDLIQACGRVVDTGEAVVFELEIPALDNRCYEARAHALGGDRFAVLFLDVTEYRKAQRDLEAGRTFLGAIVDSVDQMIWSTRPDGFHDFYNSRWYAFTGVPAGSTDGEGWNGMFHPDDQERAWARWRHSLETGEPYEIEYRLRHHTGQYRWVLGRAHAIRDAEGRVVRWMGTCTDIDAQRRDAERISLASQELSHRIKNIFAVVSGLVALSARQRPELRDLSLELRERIAALGDAHNYARPHGPRSGAMAQETGVLGLIRRLLQPYETGEPGRTVILGEDQLIDDRGATPVALAIHELATNAAKYGAFSTDSGGVTVEGAATPGGYELTWVEQGGPPVSPPRHAGFGSMLVELAVRDQLGGQLEREWRDDGLRVRLVIPNDRLNRSNDQKA